MGSSKKSKDKDREKTREERREKKKKRRSRSGSRERDREGKHHHRHHHKHKKQRTKRREDHSRSVSPSFSDESLSDVEQLLQLKDDGPAQHALRVPPPPRISAPLAPKLSAPPPPKLTVPPPPKLSRRSPSPPPAQHSGGGGDISLSIEETNKIRAKLGLKPLKLDSAPAKDDDRPDVIEIEDDTQTSKQDEFVHKPAESITQKLQVEKLREKIAAQREKRRIKEKLQKVKTLGESDSDDECALAWVKKSRQLTKERELAEKKSKMLEELDAQFGIADLVEQDMTEQKVKKYSYNDLSGLQVQHDFSRFDTGGTTILTLKDSKVLDGEEDTLINVNIMDDERAERNLKRRKLKLDELEYEAPEVDEYGNIVQRTLLTKYDEEIEGEKKQSFRLGVGGGASAYDDVPEAVRRIAKLRKLQNLETPQVQLASEYFTETEMVSFRKVKKTKKKKKKKLRADDLEPIEEESLVYLGSSTARQARLEALEVNNDKERLPADGLGTPSAGRTHCLRDLLEEEDEKVKMEDDDDDVDAVESEQDDIELQEALARSRRAKIAQSAQPSSEKILDLLKEKPIKKEETEEVMEEDGAGLVMTLNTTDEFCRTLGDLPTYGLSGNRADDEQTMLQLQQPKEKEAQEPRGAWEEVGIDDTRVEISDSMTVPILEEEPDASKGVANALKLALKKGYLEKTNVTKSANAALQHLRAVHYSIEDKAVDDERGRGRGERYMGPVTDFKDKDNYKPDVKLEYVDDEGRKLNAKEAFRYLSHKFHGKGSGKNKTEKRMKKWNEELLMKHMSSSDTPLQTLERQREKQKQLGAAYLVLSGSKTQESMDVKK
ncbi:U4/U6.U5 tri-snRNP-associated protein 1 [Procambarus clarkii]|uniref:U4/U6.U5 tri-snRNP-associated protein 1 n=1 Tax=Procambarus clarkii TaxID=6728 RepID=UPI001E6702C4|nr:U4/U6.U5 tri-snRNP-associated protein 1-like [Procambarus clarkii]